MERRTLRAAAVALIVVLAVGVAAATLNSTLQSGDSLSPGSGASGGGPGGQTPGDTSLPANLSESAADASAQLCLPVVQTTGFKLGYLGLWLGIGTVLFWRLSSRYIAAGIWTALTLQLAGIYAVLVGLCGQGIRESVVRNATNLPEGPGRELARQVGRASGEAGAYISSNPILTAVIVVLAIGLVVGLALLYSEEPLDLGGASPTEESTEAFEEEYDARALRMLGQAAGDAADRIDESGDPDNGVYRAWREMTRHIDVERPESSTPGEFAEAAIEAGMARQDVEALRAVFEEVRYGGLPPTEEAETRAIQALRNIEEAYADWEGDQA